MYLLDVESAKSSVGLLDVELAESLAGLLDAEWAESSASFPFQSEVTSTCSTSSSTLVLIDVRRSLTLRSNVINSWNPNTVKCPFNVHNTCNWTVSAYSDWVQIQQRNSWPLAHDNALLKDRLSKQWLGFSEITKYGQRCYKFAVLFRGRWSNPKSEHPVKSSGRFE